MEIKLRSQKIRDTLGGVRCDAGEVFLERNNDLLMYVGFRRV
jgi:hypothetical protein